MYLLTAVDIRNLIRRIGFVDFFRQAVTALEQDFGRWHAFSLSPRHATHYPAGVIELMPCSDHQFYTYKYVNGHPGNAQIGKLGVAAIGQISDAESGYPLLLCDMTLLTAIRTAATSVLAARYLAKQQARTLAIIGTGAQAEFQVSGFADYYSLESVRYFDSDPAAMAKFADNLSAGGLCLSRCRNAREAVWGADIVVTATAAKRRQVLFECEDVAPGAHINAIGGDCPGKTELPAVLLDQAKVVVEYLPQSLSEGEIQQSGASLVYAELWELVAGAKVGRTSAHEVTLFDSVGFALEDFSMLRLVLQLVEQSASGSHIAMLPEVDNPKDLFGFCCRS
ncbi:MAG: ornithine cyclodeaminase [Methylomicrobium sp.]